MIKSFSFRVIKFYGERIALEYRLLIHEKLIWFMIDLCQIKMTSHKKAAKKTWDFSKC